MASSESWRNPHRAVHARHLDARRHPCLLRGKAAISAPQALHAPCGHRAVVHLVAAAPCHIGWQGAFRHRPPNRSLNRSTNGRQLLSVSYRLAHGRWSPVSFAAGSAILVRVACAHLLNGKTANATAQLVFAVIHAAICIDYGFVAFVVHAVSAHHRDHLCHVAQPFLGFTLLTHISSLRRNQGLLAIVLLRLTVLPAAC